MPVLLTPSSPPQSTLTLLMEGWRAWRRSVTTYGAGAHDGHHLASDRLPYVSEGGRALARPGHPLHQVPGGDGATMEVCHLSAALPSPRANTLELVLCRRTRAMQAELLDT